MTQQIRQLEITLLRSTLPDCLLADLRLAKLEIQPDQSLVIETSDFSEARKIKQFFCLLSALILDQNCPIFISRVIFRWPYGQWVLPVDLSRVRTYRKAG